MSNDELYDAAMKAINDLFADQSVDRETARTNLQSLRDELDIMIDGLK